ncbi:U3 small nucleolar RNA-associated protein 6-domain-containing protein [Protomyces lactucae-debilis]|uniref:U3 small nucleolar RNA-associated protein 6-domain-containing protein n=1 Tax=Protomyces lactucae-debilis TaxID=2754530 RepID=A0A1Y2FKM8_PROLT|nr:U3 small nucleolar RNA-associated protein 6-domain-containing protein [Protomyces lactucae-debilis]ORY84479.1 U3 small nucleolar RNA-associated protein 6-domain-containing protein [Protomyces lactucae-debilis]
MADRAQYFLEQSLPELIDLQQKKIFTPLEIKAITRKRTGFEHALTRKIVRKADFLRYAEYEMNLEQLRRQRVKRLGITGKKTVSDFAGPRRVFFVFERAARKFHGDVDLWLQYINYAKQEKSAKVLAKLFATVLQFHPTNDKLWRMAADHELHYNGNMTAARTMMQRGLRLCKDSPDLWIAYFRLELLYLEKIHARRKILGIDGRADQEEPAAEIEEAEETDGTIKLAQTTQEELNGASQALLKDIELSSLTTAESNPALQGAIPKAILRSAVQAMPRNAELILSFYDAIAEFRTLPFQQSLQEHILELLSAEPVKSHPKAVFLRITLPLRRIRHDVASPAFPAALKESLAAFNALSDETPPKDKLVFMWLAQLVAYRAIPDIESNLARAIDAALVQRFKQSEAEAVLSPSGYTLWATFEQGRGRQSVADDITRRAHAKFPQFEHFPAHA